MTLVGSRNRTAQDAQGFLFLAENAEAEAIHGNTPQIW